MSHAAFAHLLGISRSHLCDIELALQDQLLHAGLRFTVEVKAA
jgi:hypothetical protein